MTAKRVLALCIALAGLGAGAAWSQAICGLSAGGGIGRLQQQLTRDGSAADFVYAAPGAFFDAELDFGRWYMNMSLAVLFAPFDATLGGDAVDLSGYSPNSAADLTAIGIGALFPIGDRLSAGGAIGFHVAAPALSPGDGDESKLAFEGYYGLIGLSFTPRLRYALSDSLALTLSIPLGIDFGPMSEDIVINGIDTGYDSPAIVRPWDLKPEFMGFTAGVYLTVGYFFPLSR